MVKATEIPTPEFDQSKGTFQPFNWLLDEVKYLSMAEFTTRVKDVSCGLQLILEMLEMSDMERSNEGEPVLGVYHAGVLMRLAISTSALLGDEAERKIECFNKQVKNK